MIHDPRDITIAILAGGEGSRMGRPKGLLRANGRPILEFLLDRLNWPGPTLLVTAPGRERPPGVGRFQREAVDAVAGQGPLRGVLTAMEHAQTSRVIVTALDMPMIERRHLRELVDGFQQHREKLGLMPGRLADDRRQIEPFPGIFDTRAADVVRRRLHEPRRSVAALADDPAFAVIDVSWEPAAWLNLNHPSDLQDLAKLGLRIV